MLTTCWLILLVSGYDQDWCKIIFYTASDLSLQIPLLQLFMIIEKEEEAGCATLADGY